jgi:hypothetical protein
LNNGVRLLGYNVPRLATSGGAVPLVVAWQVEGDRETSPMDYQFFAHLLDSKSRRWGGIDALDYSSPQWRQGDTVLTWYQFPVDPRAPPGIYHVIIGMYDHQGTRPVPVTGPGGRLLDNAVSLGPLKITAATGLPTAGDAIVQHRQVARLSDQVTFLGYDLPERAVKPGDVLPLTLHWMAGATRPDYTVFVHLLDQSGKVVAQVDSQPGNGEYPTSLWDEGEYVQDEYHLALPASLRPGTYRLELGLYQLESLRRLPVASEDGRPSGDRILLGWTVDVQ